MSVLLRLPLPLFAALTLGARASNAQTFSGKLVGIDGLAKPGVTVSFKRGESILVTTTTGTDGTWSLEPTTSAMHRERVASASGHLLVDGSRRLSVSFDGRVVNGRRAGLATTSLHEGMAGVATAGRAEGRAAVVPDTLVYSLADRVVLRDTISTLTASGIERVFDTTWNAGIVYGYLADSRDSRVYRTVKVGSQVWMAQNLAFRRDTSWVVKDSAEIERRYGRLYQWTAAMDTSGTFLNDLADLSLPRRGICPEGWHLPSDLEWSTLVNFVDSSKSGTVLKAVEFPSTGGADLATDLWGFRVMPGGQVARLTTYPYTNIYRAFRTNGMFWAASEPLATKAYCRNFGQTWNHSTRALVLKTEGYSVRCVQD